MKDSIWEYFIVVFGLVTIVFIFFLQKVTNTDQHNYTLLRETCESAMYDAIDVENYKTSGLVRIDKKKFLENFMRRFAENASLSRTYQIEIYDINEEPPKVSLKVSSAEFSTGAQILEFDIANNVDAIIESKY